MSRQLSVMIFLFPAWSLFAEQPSFDRDIRPILEQRCQRCHGPEEQNARIRLDQLSTDLLTDRVAAETWHEVLNVINDGSMPPEGEPDLTKREREALATWLTSEFDKIRKSGTSNRIVLRRLNRSQFQNTMADLLGIQMDFTAELPADSPSADGFTNDGGSLQMSALQLEAYLQTARRALSRVIVQGPAPQQFAFEFEEPNVTKWVRGPAISSRLQRRQSFLVTMKKEYPEAGDFLIRAKVSAIHRPDKDFPILEASVGYRPDTKILFRSAGSVELTSAGEQVLEFRGRLEDFPLPVRGQGKFPGLVIRLRNLHDDGSPIPPLPKKKNNKKKQAEPDASVEGEASLDHEPDQPVIVVHSLEFMAPVYESWPTPVHRAILYESPLREENENAYVAEVLKRFMTRAFRRPVTEEEIGRKLEFFQRIRPELLSFEDAIRETLAFVLISPEFLYHVEPAGQKLRSLTDYEIASRLSYFLWDTMPDERLFELASSKRLGDERVLIAEVERMLADRRSQRFVDRFTSEWLALDVVDHVAIDEEYHTGIDDDLKTDMQTEVQQFFGELLTSDSSALNLLDSDFTMLNSRLAGHYGIPGVRGNAFRRVQLTSDSNRGGLLSQAAFLLANSTGSDSHPVRRAVWIRDRILGDPPAPPPPDVPSLDEADPEFLKLAVREQLQIHRESAACSRCHQKIDPWGIALENYDAVGHWRTDVRRKVRNKFETSPVQSETRLPDGTEINDAVALKTYLRRERTNDFARTLVDRLLTYAIGRQTGIADEAVVDELSTDFARHEYRLSRLIEQIVLSEPFLTK